MHHWKQTPTRTSPFAVAAVALLTAAGTLTAAAAPARADPTPRRHGASSTSVHPLPVGWHTPAEQSANPEPRPRL